MKKPLTRRWALAAYLAGLALVGFWPAPVEKPILGILTTVLRHLRRLGVPSWFDHHFVEASANVAMFIPLGILVAWALPTKPWWQAAAICVLASLCMEAGQLLFISARFSSLMDVVTNTFGAVIGIAITQVLARISTMEPGKT